uniref:Putative secreted protein n=1 Tax=Anopheles triannulatus TaxID=58253 RepID=A0A2M4B4C3_9DIPT
MMRSRLTCAWCAMSPVHPLGSTPTTQRTALHTTHTPTHSHTRSAILVRKANRGESRPSPDTKHTRQPPAGRGGAGVQRLGGLGCSLDRVAAAAAYRCPGC